MFRYERDYATYALGASTKEGRIEQCPLCGKPGAYLAFEVFGHQSEKWTHKKEGFFLLWDTTTSCGRSREKKP